MPLDLSPYRTTYADLLFGDSFQILRPRRIDDGAGGTMPDPDGPELLGPFLGKFGVNAVRNAEITGDREEHRGSYTLECPVSIEILTTDQVRYADRTYNVVWTPPLRTLTLARKVGLEEA